MATCYYCLNQATSKRWVTVSHGRGGRVYVGKRGISGISAGGGSRTAVRGVCDSCARRLDQDRISKVVGGIVFVVIIVGGFFLIVRSDNPSSSSQTHKAPIVWQEKNAK